LSARRAAGGDGLGGGGEGGGGAGGGENGGEGGDEGESMPLVTLSVSLIAPMAITPAKPKPTAILAAAAKKTITPPLTISFASLFSLKGRSPNLETAEPVRALNRRAHGPTIESQDAMTGSYIRGSHSKKLEPIIESLDRFDNDAGTWAPLRARVDALTNGWNEIIRQLPQNTPEHALLSKQRDLCFEVLQLQNEFFHSHRRTCVAALKLRTAK
jgi:hypothetical protein